MGLRVGGEVASEVPDGTSMMIYGVWVDHIVTGALRNGTLTGTT